MRIADIKPFGLTLTPTQYLARNATTARWDTLERGAQTSTIAPQEKREIQQLTQDATAVLEQVESNIELETEKLIHLVEE